jgi:hypothetical protein
VGNVVPELLLADPLANDASAGTASSSTDAVALVVSWLVMGIAVVGIVGVRRAAGSVLVGGGHVELLGVADVLVKSKWRGQRCTSR